MYNEYKQNGKSLAIPGTLLISAIGIIADVTKTVTMDLKSPGNLLYCVGKTYDELGGSIYLDTFGSLGNVVPRVNFAQGNNIFAAVSKAIQGGLVRCAHDCSEGGLGVALAEMAFSGGYGATIRLDKVPYQGKDKRNDTVLFAESNSRLVLEVEPKNQKKFERLFQGSACAVIGVVDQTPGLVVYGLAGEVCIHSTLDVLKQAWQKPLQV